MFLVPVEKGRSAEPLATAAKPLQPRGQLTTYLRTYHVPCLPGKSTRYRWDRFHSPLIPCRKLFRQVEAMRSSLPLLCCATFGAAFVPNVTPSASRCGLPGGRHASRCLVPGESSWRASSGFGLDWAISHEVRVHGDGDGSGSIPATEAKIEAVEKEIEAVEEETQAVKAALSGGPAYLGITDGNFLLKQLERLQEKEKQLREDKKQLWEDNKQLREKELVLLKPAPAAVSLSGTCDVFI